MDKIRTELGQMSLNLATPTPELKVASGSQADVRYAS